jgi:hypothetical protein
MAKRERHRAERISPAGLGLCLVEAKGWWLDNNTGAAAGRQESRVNHMLERRAPRVTATLR